MKVQGQDFEEEVSAIESREDHNESVQAGKAPTPKIAGQVKHIPLNINNFKSTGDDFKEEVSMIESREDPTSPIPAAGSARQKPTKPASNDTPSFPRAMRVSQQAPAETPPKIAGQVKKIAIDMDNIPDGDDFPPE